MAEEKQDEQTKEQKFSCGCHIVDGKLEVECTNAAPQGEVSSSHHARIRPFSAKCFRLAVEQQHLAALVQEHQARIARNERLTGADAAVLSEANAQSQGGVSGADAHSGDDQVAANHKEREDLSFE